MSARDSTTDDLALQGTLRSILRRLDSLERGGNMSGLNAMERIRVGQPGLIGAVKASMPGWILEVVPSTAGVSGVVTTPSGTRIQARSPWSNKTVILANDP